MFENVALEELVFLVQNANEFDRDKADEELSRRGYTVAEAEQEVGA
mgnify:CR=1 FL=1